ncbi:MAG: hypothetical protein QOG63_2060 [Thermoleophilaceae bacterium]|jgi:hypothetical protein|nr:hypothetical protein [Thermoleophilaceae bacterium]
MIFADPIVDWGALGEVIAVSLVAGVGVTLAFSLALLGAVRFADMRRNDRTLEATFYAVLGFAGLAITIAAMVIGIVVMTQKS